MSFLLELVRHADAAPRDPAGSDSERPLSIIGQRQIRMLAERRRERGDYPERVCCSPARRACETLAAFGYDFTSVSREDPRIYEASLETLLDVVAEAQTLAGHVLIVGHNPGLQDLLSYLVGAQAPEMLTAAHVSLKLPGQPARPLRGSGQLLEHWAP